MLDLLYPNRCFNIINSGIAETTVAFAVERFKRDVLDRNPDLVLIMFGLNNYGANSALNIKIRKIKVAFFESVQGEIQQMKIYK